MRRMVPWLWSAAAIAGTAVLVVQIGSGDAQASSRALTPGGSRAGTRAASPALTRARSAEKSTSLQDTSPLDILALKKTADSLFGGQEYERALPVLRRVVEEDYDDPYYWRALGRAAARTGRHSEAVPALVRARELGIFNRWRLAVEIARAYAAMDSADAAIRWLEDALDDPHENRPTIQSDRAFDSLRDDPRFQRVAGLLSGPRLGRVEGWRHDVDFFVSEAKHMHVAPERPAHSAEFEQAAQRLRRRIPNLSDTEIYIGLKKLAVMLGDGHTGISSEGVAGITKLPIDLYSFIDGLVVVRQHGGGSSMIGHRVLGFGSLSTNEAKHAATALVSRDNPMSLESGLPGVLVTGPYLADIGAANHDGSVTLRMEARYGPWPC